MALQFRGVETNHTVLGTSNTVDVPAGVTDGDGLLLMVGGGGNIVVENLPAWSFIAQVGVAESGNRLMRVYFRRAASEPASYVIEHNFAQSVAGIIAWYSDEDRIIAYDSHAGGTILAPETQITAPSANVRRPNAVLHNFYVLDSSGEGSTPGPDMAERWEVGGSVFGYLQTQSLAETGNSGTRYFTTPTPTVFDAFALAVAISELVPVDRPGDVQILLDQYILTNQSHAAELSAGNRPYDTTTIGATGTEYEMIRGDAALRHAGYFTGVGAGYLEQEMEQRLDTLATVHTALLLGTSQPDCVGYVLPNNANFELVMSAPAKNVITVDGLWSQGTGLKRGRRIFEGVIEDTTPGDGVNLGAIGANGGYGYLFVHEVFGTASNATFEIQTDSDIGFGDPATVGTFTLSAAGAYEIELDGAVGGPYVRLACTSLGGAAAFDVTAVAVVQGVTQ